MKLKLVIVDMEIPPRWKKWGLRVGIPAAVLIGGGAIAWAGNLVTWTDGQPLKSADLNNNFSYLQGEITALQAAQAQSQAFQVQATADGGFSVGATYCGATAATAGSFSGPGALTGYASAKASCQAVSGCSAAAHMCSGEEIVRTRQVGHAVAFGGATNEGWTASGVYNYYGPGTADTSDCNGWTTAGGSTAGSTWYVMAAFSQPALNYCSASQPILCCN